MNKKVLGVFVTLLTVSMLALSMSPANATQSTTVTWQSFSGSYLPPFTPPQSAGENTIYTANRAKTYTGDIEATGISHFRMVMHKDGVTTSATTTVAVTQLMGQSVEGTLTLKHGSIGLWRIISGTGDLANLRGQGTIYKDENTPAGAYTFSGKVHFDPNV